MGRPITGSAIVRGLFKASFLFLFACLGVVCGCSDDADLPGEEPEVIPATCLANNKIYLSDIAGIPESVTFNKVKVEISGSCWEVIDLVEAPYEDGKAVLLLPASFPAGKLQPAIRIDGDICGHWEAVIDRPEARVAALKDIIAYHDEQRVGRIYLTDWEGEGSTLHKSYLYYQYADSPFTLSGFSKTYTYKASFEEGWNAYANVNQLESSRSGGVLCTTSIAEELSLVWRFNSFK